MNNLFLGGHPLTPFNRAKLMNIGFDIAQRRDFDCIFFSDSDLMPMDDRVPLKCIEKPRHYSIWFEIHIKFLAFWHEHEKSATNLF